MRKAGEVTYTDAHNRMGERRGEVCFEKRAGLYKAMRSFQNHKIHGRRIKIRITVS